MFFVLYNMASGRIDSAFEGDNAQVPEMALAAEQGILFVPANPDFDYVVGGVVVPRPKLCESRIELAADGVTEVAFTVPAGTKLIFDGNVTAIDDGWFQFRTGLPATYQMAFVPPFPFQTQLVEIVAHAG